MEGWVGRRRPFHFSTSSIFLSLFLLYLNTARKSRSMSAENTRTISIIRDGTLFGTCARLSLPLMSSFRDPIHEISMTATDLMSS